MEPFGEAQVREFMAAHGLQGKIHTFADSTKNASLAARALGVQEAQIVKSIVFLADGKTVLVLMSGDMNVHTSKLKKCLGARKLRMADSETVLMETGYPVGAVPPVAHLHTMPTYLDVSLRRFSEIYPAAGSLNSMFRTTFEELLRLTKARIIDVSTPKKALKQ